jgi:hypothetical protein
LNPGTTVDGRVADDWKCTDGTPITHVKWWGQYHPYLDAQAGPVVAPTTNAPTAFWLRQYANNAADPANTKPGALIKEVKIPIADCNQTYVQSMPWPSNPTMNIHIFSYEATLVLPWTQEKDSIYWLSVQAEFAVEPVWADGFLHWDWMSTPAGDFLGTGLSSGDAGANWSNPFAPDKVNFAFELLVPAKLVLLPGALTAGQIFSVYLALVEDITQPFDFYILADTPAGPYTLSLNGKITKGITPLYKSVPSFTKDYITTVRPAVKIPASMKGKTITFYAVIVQAGKKPPVKKLSDLTATTQYVVLMDKAAAVVN